MNSSARSIELSTTPRQPGLGVYAPKKAALAKSREKKLERYLDSAERVEKPKPAWNLRRDFGTPTVSGRDVLALRGVAVGYPGYADVLRGISLEEVAGERVAVIGRNGAGKTTLLRRIAGELNQGTGERVLGQTVRIGMLRQDVDGLDPAQTVLATARDVLCSKRLGASCLRSPVSVRGGVRYSAGSVTARGGERTRFKLALLVLRGCTLLLLDEPHTHLDVDGREQFELALEAFSGAIIAVSHDRAFIRSFATRTVLVADGTARGPDSLAPFLDQPVNSDRQGSG
ncbi:MAG: hypothetical protein KatS3mg060_1705 [Dehalococcoidia bacterium]|nr:MAG: hypothetical protein KatS3mg060_1705 [Dehalococcoidia bacterium]